MTTIRDYLAEREAVAKGGLPRGSVARLVRRITPHGLRQWVKLNGTTLLVPYSRFRARTIARSTRPLRLHLGSGTHRLTGWVNVDILGMRPDLYWDLQRGVPFPDRSANTVFLEHVLEHFSLREGMELLSKCFRVLEPGGTIRVGVPDFGRYLESYSGDRLFIEQERPGRPTPLLAVGEVALSHGHRSVWDGDTLELALVDLGFVDVKAKAFGESSIEPPPDSPSRESESIYAEGRRPGATA